MRGKAGGGGETERTFGRYWGGSALKIPRIPNALGKQYQKNA